MNENTETLIQKFEDLSETLKRRIISSGIEGKTNGLICFQPNRQDFLKDSVSTIAWTALEQRLVSGSYEYIGLQGMTEKSLMKLVKSFPHHELANTMRGDRVFLDGKKDYLAIFMGGNPTVSYVWMPSRDSTGDIRPSRNILLTELNIEGVKILQNIASQQPTKIYDILISTLFPNTFTPISEDEIINAVKSEGPELLRIARGNRRDEVIERYENRLKDPKGLVPFVRSKSVLKRFAPCTEVEVLVQI